jgi:hypothetical protein
MKKHVSKEEWVAMYEEMGWDGPKRMQWHQLFESRHPDGHRAFLEWLGIPPKEIDEIRAECR